MKTVRIACIITYKATCCRKRAIIRIIFANDCHHRITIKQIIGFDHTDPFTEVPVTMFRWGTFIEEETRGL